MNEIRDYLKHQGPSLTSEVSDHLVKSLGLSPAAARKRVSRTSDDVKRLAFITFPRKARFIYLQGQFGSPDYWRRLVAALQTTNSAYGHAIAAVRLRDGVIPERHFAIACGAPVRQSRHLSPETILARLENAGLLQKVDVPGLGTCVCLVQSDGHYEHLALSLRARLITENILLTAVRDWVRKLGLVSYERVTLRDANALPMVGTFAWDMTAPSYLGHMSRVGKDGAVKPGFFACDVYLDRQVDVAGIGPFIKKCLSLRTLRNIGPCMQMFVAERYSGDAFQLLKKHGIIPATPRSLFGDEVAEGLAQVTSVLITAARYTLDPVRLNDLFKRLSKIEGAANQLRGTLLEFMVAGYWRRETDHVWMNRIFKSEGESAEADVVAVKDGATVTFIECKGYSPYATIPDALVKRWLQNSIPLFYKVAREHPDWKNLNIRFEFWASGRLSDEAIAMFDTARTKIKASRYSVELLTGTEILANFMLSREGSLAISFQNHFMRSPTEETELARPGR